MATTRKKTPTRTGASDPPPAPRKAARRPRKPTRAKVILAPEVADLFAAEPPVAAAEPPVAAAGPPVAAAEPSVAVAEADIVVDVVIPEPPRTHAVADVDIVADVAAPTPVEAPRPGVQLVHVPTPPEALARGRAAWTVAALAAVMLIVSIANHARHAHAPTPPRPAPPPGLAMSPPPLTPAPAPAVLARAHGHALFAAGQRREALRDYERALRLDAHVADAQLIGNLLACYGLRQTQPIAAALIVRFQLLDARGGLASLAREARTHGTRMGARYTLEKLHGEPAAGLSS